MVGSEELEVALRASRIMSCAINAEKSLLDPKSPGTHMLSVSFSRLHGIDSMDVALEAIRTLRDFIESKRYHAFTYLPFAVPLSGYSALSPWSAVDHVPIRCSTAYDICADMDIFRLDVCVEHRCWQCDCLMISRTTRARYCGSACRSKAWRLLKAGAPV